MLNEILLYPKQAELNLHLYYDQSKTPRHKILYLRNDKTGCWFYRIYQNIKVLVESNYAKCICADILNMDTILELQPEIVIIQRAYRPGEKELIENLKKAGFVVLYDIDDDFFNIPKENPCWVSYKNKKFFEDVLGLCDGVIASTDNLKKVLLPYNKNIDIIENLIDIDWWNSIKYINQKIFNNDLTTIGFFGTATHEIDFKNTYCLKALEVLLKEGSCNIVMCGYYPKIFEKYITNQKHNNFFGNNLLFLNGAPIDKFYQLMKTFHIDIGLLPLIDNKFNQSKSLIKYYEYIMSNISPITNQECNFCKYTPCFSVSSSEKGWIKGIYKLIENPDLRQNNIDKGKYFINQYKGLFQNSNKIIDVLRKYIKEF
jgi:hypothetical protein